MNEGSKEVGVGRSYIDECGKDIGVLGGVLKGELAGWMCRKIEMERDVEIRNYDDIGSVGSWGPMLYFGGQDVRMERKKEELRYGAEVNHGLVRCRLGSIVNDLLYDN